MLIWSSALRPQWRPQTAEAVCRLLGNAQAGRDGGQSFFHHCQGLCPGVPQANRLPCLVLARQHRIVSGGFDVAKEVIYDDIPDDQFSYGDRAGLGFEHPDNKLAVKVENFVRAPYGAQASPQGKVLPLFMHCRGSPAEDPTTKSRYNETQNAVAVELLVALFEQKIITKSDQAVVITPYRFRPLRQILATSRYQHR